MGVEPVPQGYHSVNISLTFKDAMKAIELYQEAFGAEVVGGIAKSTDGKQVRHAELQIGDTRIFLNDDVMNTGKTVEGGHAGAFTPHLWVTDVVAAWQRALKAGCKETKPLELQFWGDRYGIVVDPFGLQWGIATHEEDVSFDEMKKRMANEHKK
jgi:PhnB protein